MAWTLKSLEWVQEVSRTANPNLEGVLMLIYQLKIEIKPYKPDEFVDSLSSLVTSIRREKGCLDFRHDVEKQANMKS